MDSKKYWDEKIICWEDSMQADARVPLIERVAAHFRTPLLHRADLSLRMVAPISAGQRVLELGCGSGFFAFRLMEAGRPMQYTGIDISARAIQRATTLAKEGGWGERAAFAVGDAVSMLLPKVDIVIGLGFLDYLTGEEIRTLFARLETTYIFFSFSERRPSLRRLIHQCYLLSQHCPKHFYYTKDEMYSAINHAFPDTQFLGDPRLSFSSIVHNLPRR